MEFRPPDPDEKDPLPIPNNFTDAFPITRTSVATVLDLDMKSTVQNISHQSSTPAIAISKPNQQNVNPNTYKNHFPPLTSNFLQPLKKIQTTANIDTANMLHVRQNVSMNQHPVNNPTVHQLNSKFNHFTQQPVQNAQPKQVQNVVPNPVANAKNASPPAPPNIILSYASRLRASQPDEEQKIEIKAPVITTKQGLPAVLFNREDFLVNLASKCRFTLIGKFSSTMPKMEVIRKSLTSQLQIKGNCKVTHFNSTHVYIDLDNEIDHSMVWNKKRIFIEGRLMRLLVWTPTFTPQVETSIAPVWVVLPELPWHCYTMSFVTKLLEPIGRVLFFDAASIQKTRGSVAKVKVEIDISKPRPPHLWLGFPQDEGDVYGEGRWQELQFESVPDYCNHCKHQGHSIDQCKVRIREEEYQKKKKDQEETVKGTDEDMRNKSGNDSSEATRTQKLKCPTQRTQTTHNTSAQQVHHQAPITDKDQSIQQIQNGGRRQHPVNARYFQHTNAQEINMAKPSKNMEAKPPGSKQFYVAKKLTEDNTVGQLTATLSPTAIVQLSSKIAPTNDLDSTAVANKPSRMEKVTVVGNVSAKLREPIDNPVERVVVQCKNPFEILSDEASAQHVCEKQPALNFRPDPGAMGEFITVASGSNRLPTGVVGEANAGNTHSLVAVNSPEHFCLASTSASTKKSAAAESGCHFTPAVQTNEPAHDIVQAPVDSTKAWIEKSFGKSPVGDIAPVGQGNHTSVPADKHGKNINTTGGKTKKKSGKKSGKSVDKDKTGEQLQTEEEVLKAKKMAFWDAILAKSYEEIPSIGSNKEPLNVAGVNESAPVLVPQPVALENIVANRSRGKPEGEQPSMINSRDCVARTAATIDGNPASTSEKLATTQCHPVKQVTKNAGAKPEGEMPVVQATTVIGSEEDAQVPHTATVSIPATESTLVIQGDVGCATLSADLTPTTQLVEICKATARLKNLPRQLHSEFKKTINSTITMNVEDGNDSETYFLGDIFMEAQQGDKTPSEPETYFLRDIFSDAQHGDKTPKVDGEKLNTPNTSGKHKWNVNAPEFIPKVSPQLGMGALQDDSDSDESEVSLPEDGVLLERMDLYDKKGVLRRQNTIHKDLPSKISIVPPGFVDSDPEFEDEDEFSIADNEMHAARIGALSPRVEEIKRPKKIIRKRAPLERRTQPSRSSKMKSTRSNDYVW